MFARKIHIFLLTLAGWIFAASFSGTAQTPDTAAVDGLARKTMEEWKVPGAAVAIVRGGEVIHLKGYGVKQLGTTAAVTPDTLFAVGSTTKAFTAAAIAMLVDEGKMSWDEPVRTHVPFFHLADPLADEYVTIRDLLCHRTGLSRNDLLWFQSPWNQEEVIRRVGKVGLTKPFRSAWQYQNIMFSAAGYAAGIAAGESWQQFVQSRIFDPLGMTESDFSSTAAEKSPDHASPHTQAEEKVLVIPWYNLDNIAPAGAINSSARDLAKWVSFQLSDGTVNGRRLLSSKNLAEMHTPQMAMRLDDYGRFLLSETTQIAYGLGWEIFDYRGEHVVAHGGAINGFRASIALLPKYSLGVVVLSNLNQVNMPEALAFQLMDLLLGRPRKNWNALYREAANKHEADQKRVDEERERKRFRGTHPARDLDAYAGAYENAAYGVITVAARSDSLGANWRGGENTLEHYQFDTFKVHAGVLAGDLVTFHLGANGEVGSLDVIDQSFTRVR